MTPLFFFISAVATCGAEVGRTLIISLRCDSGSRPAMGRILIFCVLEQRSARDKVIFLWVALSVEWGLEIQNDTDVRPKLTDSFYE